MGSRQADRQRVANQERRGEKRIAAASCTSQMRTYARRTTEDSDTGNSRQSGAGICLLAARTHRPAAVVLGVDVRAALFKQTFDLRLVAFRGGLEERHFAWRES